MKRRSISTTTQIQNEKTFQQKYLQISLFPQSNCKWKNLPPEKIEATSINNFKNKLDKAKFCRNYLLKQKQKTK
jgi:hypothetical protein